MQVFACSHIFIGYHKGMNYLSHSFRSRFNSGLALKTLGQQYLNLTASFVPWPDEKIFF